jgi:hypothetical protein
VRICCYTGSFHGEVKMRPRTACNFFHHLKMVCCEMSWPACGLHRKDWALCPVSRCKFTFSYEFEVSDVHL